MQEIHEHSTQQVTENNLFLFELRLRGVGVQCLQSLFAVSCPIHSYFFFYSKLKKKKSLLLQTHLFSSLYLQSSVFLSGHNFYTSTNSCFTSYQEKSLKNVFYSKIPKKERLKFSWSFSVHIEACSVSPSWKLDLRLQFFTAPKQFRRICWNLVVGEGGRFSPRAPSPLSSWL